MMKFNEAVDQALAESLDVFIKEVDRATDRSVAQMKALLDDLMEFTSYRLGKGLSLSPEHLLLDQFARNTLDEIDAISSGRVLLLQCQGDMGVEWDARRFHQVLSNLVFNALKYGFPSSPVSVGLDGTSKSEVLLTVRNTGKPIPAGLLPRLFDPLVREHSEDGDSGSQLAGAKGLACTWCAK